MHKNEKSKKEWSKKKHFTILNQKSITKIKKNWLILRCIRDVITIENQYDRMFVVLWRDKYQYLNNAVYSLKIVPSNNFFNFLLLF